MISRQELSLRLERRSKPAEPVKMQGVVWFVQDGEVRAARAEVRRREGVRSTVSLMVARRLDDSRSEL